MGDEEHLIGPANEVVFRPDESDSRSAHEGGDPERVPQAQEDAIEDETSSSEIHLDDGPERKVAVRHDWVRSILRNLVPYICVGWIGILMLSMLASLVFAMFFLYI